VEVEEVAAVVEGVDTTVMMELMALMALLAGALLQMEVPEIRETTEEVEVVVVVVAAAAEEEEN